MAFPSGTLTGATALDAYIPLVWGEKINEFYRNKLVCAPFFTDRSDELAGGGDTLYTPTTTEMSANAKAATVMVTLNSVTDTKVTLTVNQWYECSFAIEDNDAAQLKKSYSLMERYAKNAGYEIAKTLDTAIIAKFSGFTNVVGSSVNTYGDSDIRAAFAYLETTGVDLSEAAFFLSPNQFWRQVQGLDKFSLAVNSPTNNPVSRMPAATLYGVPVYVTAQLTSAVSGGKNGALATPDAIHWATSALGTGGSKSTGMVGSNGVRVQSNYAPEYLSTITTADILYGVALNRPTGGVQILTS
jgi:hypothetical protein